jgi:hypothetical protein
MVEWDGLGMWRVWVRRGGCIGSWWGKPEGKRPMGRPRLRWVDNIRPDLQEVGCGYMDWIGLAQDRDRWRTLVSAVKYLRVPWNAGNFLNSCKPVSCSRRTLHSGVNKSCIYIYYLRYNYMFRLLRIAIFRLYMNSQTVHSTAHIKSCIAIF